MDESDFLFSLPPEKYLERFHVLTYLEDAVHQLLDFKEENPRVVVNKFLTEYFSSLKNGTHVAFRDYAFIRSTLHNRACLAKCFWKCYRAIGRKGDPLSVLEYHSLLGLLCSDFPLPLVQKTAMLTTMTAVADCQMSFTDFVYAFQIRFCYDDFLTKAFEIYKQLQKSKQNPHDPVYVPTSENAAKSSEDNAIHSGDSRPDGVDSMAYLRALLPLCEEMALCAPPQVPLKDILTSVERVTYYGFLNALAHSEAINQYLGYLPPRAHLLDVSDQELSASDYLLKRCSFQYNNSSEESSKPLIAPRTPSKRKTPKLLEPIGKSTQQAVEESGPRFHGVDEFLVQFRMLRASVEAAEVVEEEAAGNSDDQ